MGSLKKILRGSIDQKIESFDKSIFKDSLAFSVEWKPLNLVPSSTYARHKITKEDENNIVFSSTSSSNFLPYFLIGMGLLFIFLILTGKMHSSSYVAGIIGFVGMVLFVIVGLLLKFMDRERNFNKFLGILVIKGVGIKTIDLKSIHAIQLLPVFIRDTSGFSNVCIHFNLVLKSTKRVQLTGYGPHVNQARVDADKISKFLQIPLWDVTSVLEK